MWSLLGLLWIHRRYEHKNIIHLFKFRFHSVYFKMQKISAPSHSSFFSFLSMMSCIYILSDPHRLSEPCLSELRQWNSQVNAGKVENLFPDGKVRERQHLWAAVTTSTGSQTGQGGPFPGSGLQQRWKLPALASTRLLLDISGQRLQRSHSHTKPFIRQRFPWPPSCLKTDLPSSTVLCCSWNCFCFRVVRSIKMPALSTEQRASQII